MECGKSGCSEHNSCNISETEQDRAKVVTDCLYEVIHDVPIGVKMHDFE